jgi:hypothetical protein
MNKQITVIELPLQIDSRIIAMKIDSQVQEIIRAYFQYQNSFEIISKKAWPILQVTPKQESKYRKEFIQKQKSVSFFVLSFFPHLDISTVNNDIEEEAWQTLHKWIIEQLLMKLASFKEVNLLNVSDDKFQWLNKFYSFILKEVTEGTLDQNKYSIIPDQNGNFHPKKDLFKDEIPELFKSKEFESFGISFKEKLLHSEIKTVSLNQTKTIKDVVLTINQLFEDYETKYKGQFNKTSPSQDSTSQSQSNRFSKTPQPMPTNQLTIVQIQTNKKV